VDNVAITSSTAGLTIWGQDAKTCILQMGNTNTSLWTFSGAGVTMYGVTVVTGNSGLSGNTVGWLTFSGANANVNNCFFQGQSTTSATTGNGIVFNSAQGMMHHNQFSLPNFFFSFVYSTTQNSLSIDDNEFMVNSPAAYPGSCVYYISSANSRALSVSDNHINSEGAQPARSLIYIQTAGSMYGVRIIGNKLQFSDTLTYGGAFIEVKTNTDLANAGVVISGNVVGNNGSVNFQSGPSNSSSVYQGDIK